MNAYADYVVKYLFAQSWQIAILAAIVGLLSFVLRNRSAHIRYLLWLIVLAKCLVPPFLAVPLAVLPEGSSSPFAAPLDLSDELSVSGPSVLLGEDTQPLESRFAMPSARQWVTLGWMAGVLVFLLWVGGRAARYTAWLRARRQPLPPLLGESTQDSSLGFRFRKWPRIWLVEDISQPFVWGLLRGSVYLPADFAGLRGSNQQRSMLAHELSHVARFDAGVNLLQVLAQAVYWFHPFVWWANRRIRQEREKCCDEMAVARLHTLPEHYTGAIVDALAAEHHSSHPIPSLAIVGSVRDIEERIKTMLTPGKTFRTRPTLLAAIVASLIALVTVPTALVLTARGQVPSTPEPAKSDGTDKPRFAARTFNSQAAFNVWVQDTYSVWTRKQIGRTPSETPLEIPACWIWGVQPSAPADDWDLLTREIDRNGIPGLTLVGVSADSVLKQVAGLAELRSLELMGDSGITDTGLEYIGGMTGLQALALSFRPITDAGLEHLKGMTGLVALHLTGTRVTDAGLEHLKDCTQLQILGLQGTQITDSGLEHLKGMTRMGDLTLRDTKIVGTGMVHLRTMTRLKNLNLTNTKTTDVSLESLKSLTELETLYLDQTPITDAGLEHLKGLTSLKKLYLSNTKVTDAGLEHLRGLSRLEDLALGGTRTTDAGMACLGTMPHLRALILSGTQITDAGLEQMRGLAGLKSLRLGGTQVTDAGVQRLQQALPNLTIERGAGQSGAQSAGQAAPAPTASALNAKEPEQPRYAARTFNSPLALDVWVQETAELWSIRRIGSTPSDAPLEIPACWLWGVRLLAPLDDWGLLRREMNQNEVPGLITQKAVDSDLRQLAGLTTLRLLDLSASEITDAGLEYLMDMSALEQLNLQKTKITDAGLGHLKILTNLKALIVGWTGITDAGLIHLKGMTGLQTLMLQANPITDLGIEHIKGIGGLQSLTLGGTKITDAALEHINSMTELQDLMLQGTSITDEGLEHLKGLTKLRRIALLNTQVTDTGIQQLQRALPDLSIMRPPAR